MLVVSSTFIIPSLVETLHDMYPFRKRISNIRIDVDAYISINGPLQTAGGLRCPVGQV